MGIIQLKIFLATPIQQLSKMREFEYDGNKIKMFQHVGIGTARSKSETIRIHFFVDRKKRKIIIGYCGEHLDVKST